MSYSNALHFLQSKTTVCELINQFGARIAVCPDWNARVMTSSCNGLNGESLGYINVPAIESGSDFQNQFGGENQLLFPYFPDFSDYPKYTIHEGPFEIINKQSSFHLTLSRVVANEHQNTCWLRKLTLLDADLLADSFSDEVLDVLSHPETSHVSYSSQNTLLNQGTQFAQNKNFKNLLFPQIKSSLNATPFSVVLLPVREGIDDLLGPAMHVESFAPLPRRRLLWTKPIALFRADGVLDAQLTVSRRRTLYFCGAIDMRAGILTILQFSEESSENDLADCDPAIRVINHGHKSNRDLPFYDICIAATSEELKTGESTTLFHTTTHIITDREKLAFLTQKIFGVRFADLLTFITH
ncbi:MAG: DUF6786 family protein [Thermoguttaceae bacterium]